MTLVCGRRHRVLGVDLNSTNLLLNDDAAEWNSGTAYAVGDRVRREQSGAAVLGTWRIFECIQAHTNKNPNVTANQNTFWVLVSYASRFIPFDDGVSLTPQQDTGFYYWRINTEDLGTVVQYIAAFNAGGETLKITQLKNQLPAFTQNGNSEAFGNTLYWTQVNLSAVDINVDAVADPRDGMHVVDEIVENTANAQHGLTEATGGISYTSGTNYFQFIYAKRGSGSRNLRLTLPSAAFGASCYTDFTLSGAGSVSNSGGASGTITAMADGWYLCFITKAATATVSTDFGTIRMLSGSTVSYTGDGTSSLYLFGFNAAAGSVMPANYYAKIDGFAYLRQVLKTHTFLYNAVRYKDAQPYNPNAIVATPDGLDQAFDYEVQITKYPTDDTRPRIGEIVFVYDVEELGQMIGPLDESLLDFSVKERDDFGNTTLLPRNVADDINYTFLTDKANRNRVKSVLKARRAEPLVFFDDADLNNDLGILSFGFIVGYSMPLLPSDAQIVSLDTEGLT